MVSESAKHCQSVGPPLRNLPELRSQTTVIVAAAFGFVDDLDPRKCGAMLANAFLFFFPSGARFIARTSRLTLF